MRHAQLIELKIPKVIVFVSVCGVLFVYFQPSGLTSTYRIGTCASSLAARHGFVAAFFHLADAFCENTQIGHIIVYPTTRVLIISL